MKNTLEYLQKLHQKAEETEVSGWDFAPRGSLLVYIDDYLTTPLTVLDRTAGQFKNLMLTAESVDPRLGNRIAIREFDAGRVDDAEDGDTQWLWNPTNHGDFSKAPFWYSEFWFPAESVVKRR